MSVAGHVMRRLSENVFIKLAMSPRANPTDGVFPSSSTYIDVSEYARFAFLVMVGGTDDTAVTCQVVQATAAAGTGSKVITGAALTGTELAGSNDNQWSIIEVERSRMDIANNFQYVAVDVAATGGSATAMAILFLGWRGRKLPPTFGADLAEQIFVDG
jgi:hypothetical protein